MFLKKSKLILGLGIALPAVLPNVAYANELVAQSSEQENTPVEKDEVALLKEEIAKLKKEVEGLSAVSEEAKAAKLLLVEKEKQLDETEKLVKQEEEEVRTLRDEQLSKTEAVTVLSEQEQTLSGELAQLQEEIAQKKAELEEREANIFIRPIANASITSAFGEVRSFSTPAGYVDDVHRGVDYVNGNPTEAIQASNHGEVVYAGWVDGGGNGVILKHKNGLYSYYYHLSVISVTVGQQLKRGEILGNMGNTGLSTGPHLHFGISKSLYGDYIDPEGLVQK